MISGVSLADISNCLSTPWVQMQNARKTGPWVLLSLMSNKLHQPWCGITSPAESPTNSIIIVSGWGHGLLRHGWLPTESRPYSLGKDILRSIRHLGPVAVLRQSFSGMGIPMLKIRWSWDRLIFNIGIPILVRRYLYVETGTRCLIEQKIYELQFIILWDALITLRYISIYHIHLWHMTETLTFIKTLKFSLTHSGML